MKKIAVLTIIGAAGLSLTGCITAFKTPAVKTENAADVQTDTKMSGQVKSVNGSEVTVQLGKVEKAKVNLDEPDVFDEKDSDDSLEFDVTQFEASDTTMTFTLENPEVKVEQDGEAKSGTVSDIVPDQVITFAFNKAHKVNKVTVNEVTGFKHEWNWSFSL